MSTVGLGLATFGMLVGLAAEIALHRRLQAAPEARAALEHGRLAGWPVKVIFWALAGYLALRAAGYAVLAVRLTVTFLILNNIAVAGVRSWRASGTTIRTQARIWAWSSAVGFSASFSGAYLYLLSP
jgi:hypothetical protein